MAEQKRSASATLPKNIRQIGTSTGSTRVYLEDYVYTYLHTKNEEETWTHRGFMLLGRMERDKDSVRYFISGLIRLSDEFFNGDILEFDDTTWAYIYQEMKKYYDDLEIVGWGQDVSGASASMTAEIERDHKQNFNIQKNVLFLLDQVENEEAFYIFEKNMMQRREGYYVYYEKNPQMQEYMIESRKSQQLDIPPEEIQEPLVHNYRETMLNKKEQLAARKWNGILYATSLMLVLSVCVLGISTVNNVEKMQNLESAVDQISGRVGQAGAAAAMSGQAQDAAGDGDSGQVSAADDQGDIDGQKQDTQVEDADISVNTGVDDLETTMQATAGGSDRSTDTGQPSADPDDNTDDTEQISSDSLETAALTEAQTYLLQGYYIVQKGDSLVGISKKIYGTAKKAKKICELNGIEDMDKIFVGQKLELP